MITFYMTPGSCSTGIHVLLEELQLVFAAHVMNLPAGDQFKPEFLAINPKGTIPVLTLDNGKSLTSFQSIAWWLAQTYPNQSLLTKNVDTQAQVMDMMNFIVGTIHGQGFTRIFTAERYALREEDHPAIQQQGHQLVSEYFNLVDLHLQHHQPYLFDTFTIADAALFYVEFWADRLHMPLPDTCTKHLQLMRSRPIVKQVLMEEGYYK